MPNATALDDVLLALAHPVRRRVFEILFAGEARVADIAVAVAATREELETHIALLEAAGLVTRLKRRDGDALIGNPAPLSVAATWINTNRELWVMRVEMPGVRPASLGQPQEPLPVRDRGVDHKQRRPRPSGQRDDKS
ncbi:helix-turn-helix protein [Ensifer adhaerens]|nr:helix-turn-helix protein [Ensifer adhaerens]